ncbi:MAG: metal ABC transporter ATP-binding protein [Desulfatiglans sp.]|nr:metal ABC transporter ATP-binding protein [Desulfatiglans sp.]
MAIIEISDVDFSFEKETVLKDVNLMIPHGDFAAIIGPNGGGKTTLLKLILGLLAPHKGSILVDGKPPQKASRCIGYVPQNVHVNRSFPITALDVVLMGMINSDTRADRSQAIAALARMEMEAYADRKIGSLSGGQRQRVFIARALVSGPKLLLLDEPTASIDAKGQTDFYRLLKELNNGITILLVSHDLLLISRYVKSVACVNKKLYYHNQAEITGEMLEHMYAGSTGETCPVELIAHGMPHRVLKDHEVN